MIAATLFSGIGGPECAMPHWDWRWCAEIEKFPSAVLKARHPTSVNLGDINAEDFVERAQRIGRPDVIVFGSPCQDFSVAGRRVGLDGDRGNLALVALGIVNRLRPRWMVFENVPGLLSSRSGSAEAERQVREGPVGGRADGDEDSDFAAFLALVQQCGYLGCYRITDAQYAGVPQRRCRIFAVFHLGDWRPAAAVLFEPEGLRGDHPPSRETGKGVAPTISARPSAGGGLGTDFDLDGGLDESAVEVLIAKPLSAARGVASSHREDMETYVVDVGNPDGPVGSVSSKWSKGSGGPAGDECYNLVVGSLNANGKAPGSATSQDAEKGLLVPIAFGGNNSKGPIEVATARNAHAGPAVRQDFESETFVVAFDPRDRGDDGRGYEREPNFSEISPAITVKQPAVIVFDETQITSAENRCQPKNGDPSHPLVASARPPAIAFNWQGGGNQTMLGYDADSDLTGTQSSGQHPAVAINMRGREGGALPELSDAASLRSPSGGSSRSFVFKASHFTRGKDGQPSGVSTPLGAEPDKGDQDPILLTGTAVRRLTPTECERLQAFPDGWTDIIFRGKPATDGPRYRALGNAMCVAEIRWVLQRIELFEKLKG
jgi:DNA (cytosine-5)-methyltransferase 1